MLGTKWVLSGQERSSVIAPLMARYIVVAHCFFGGFLGPPSRGALGYTVEFLVENTANNITRDEVVASLLCWCLIHPGALLRYNAQFLVKDTAHNACSRHFEAQRSVEYHRYQVQRNAILVSSKVLRDTTLSFLSKIPRTTEYLMYVSLCFLELSPPRTPLIHFSYCLIPISVAMVPIVL